nr:pentatricopeptide repeat-containing protein At1g62260, mitochondrial [Ipomoea batatas]GMD57342.1 pentatricopeptide repeat-containing protein At1g62260, mitochondrial [Ipomoea batatas]
MAVSSRNLSSYRCPLMALRHNRQSNRHSRASGAYIAKKQTCQMVNYFSTLKPRVSRDPPELWLANKKITELIRRGRLEDARSLFDKLRHRIIVTWNSMLTGYIQRREMAKAQDLFDEMPERDVVSWNLMISGYMSCRGSAYIEYGRYLFDRMPMRDIISWNTMITGYAKIGKIDEALKLFDCIPEKNVVSWNAVISGLFQNGEVKTAIEFFNRMPERDAASLSALVSGLIQNDKLDIAANVLFDFQRSSNKSSDLVYAFNTLIVGYGQKGRIDDARHLFDQIPFYTDRGIGQCRRFERNVVSWNSMIMCYVKAGNMVSARELFDLMVEKDTFSWNTMISGYVRISNMEEASNLFSMMPNPDAFSWNTIISGYAQGGKLKLACDFFQRMPQKNRVSWNSMIAAYERNADYKGAIRLFIQMQLAGEKPDRHTLSSLLGICAETVALCLGMQIHQLVTKTVIPDVPLNNSLITMYARCGAIMEARSIFDRMKFCKDVISWNAMIGGYASHGLATEAFELFDRMKELKMKPTYITFIAVLSACAHAGLVEEGRFHFKSMVDEFGIEPRLEHFASLVDIVGRHGRIEEAMDIVKSMPVKPDKVVWGALLGACRVHNNLEFAQTAAEALMQLEPESSGPYILLYNMYIEAGRLDDANEIRMRRERNSVKKEPAYSMVNSIYP